MCENARPTLRRLKEDDEGELDLALAVVEGHVYIDFGKPVAWIGMSPQDARDFGVHVQTIANEADPDPFLRASGDCVCDVCGDQYRHHPHDMKQLGYGDEPFLRVLCNGRRVKL